MEMLISTKGNVIPAKQSSGSTAPINENSEAYTKAKVIGLAQFNPKGYPSTNRLVCQIGTDKVKVSSWEECSPGQEIHLYKKEGEIKGENGKNDTTIYWYIGVNQPLKGE